jgi:hypothetical protein
MSHGLIITVLVCLAIFFGSLEQARIILRRQPKIHPDAIEARRNTLRGDLSALVLGIKQVQGYIDKLKNKQSEESLNVSAEAQTILDKANAIKQEVEGSLEKAQSETAIQICALRLDQARFHVRNARSLIEKHTGLDDENQDADK